MSLFNEHFTISNIPFGVVSIPDQPKHQIATRLYGDVFIVPTLIEKGLLGNLEPDVKAALHEPTLNQFASLGRAIHRQVRQKLQALLRSWPATTTSNGNGQNHTNGTNSSSHASNIDQLKACSYPVTDVKTHLPIHPRDFSDFSCSKDHVLNAGEAVLGERKLPPGFLHFPVGYAGRCSSIVPSGTVIRRPKGQFRSKAKDGSTEVVFEPSRAVDFELEVACVVGKGTEFGKPVRIEEADEHVFGLVLLNDWSARDIQGLEMNPLGPFNGKSFGTTISPWIITIDALSPFECPAPPKDVSVATYLNDPRQNSTYSIQLQATIDTSSKSTVVCTSRFQSLYWTLRDMIAHQTINGCPLTPGDFLATGTISETKKGTHGCLLEVTKGGKEILELSDGTKRTYLMDGDAVRLSGWAGELGSEQCVGFGESFGVLEAALE